MATNTTKKPYQSERCERAVRMVREHEGEYASRWAALTSIAEKFGCKPETLRNWLRQAERDEGTAAGMSSSEPERLKQLERENKELRQSLTGELARNIIVSDTCRCVYVSTPKVDSSSVKLALLRAESELSEVSEQKIHDMARRHFKRPPREIAEILRDDRYFRFCIVRHPVDRFVSGFRNKLKRRDYRAAVLRQLGEKEDRQVSMDEFVAFVAQQPDAERNRHWRSQTGLLYPVLFDYHTVAKIEQLSADWARIAERLGLPRELPRINASRGKGEAATVSRDLRNRIAEIYQQDMITFGYDVAGAKY